MTKTENSLASETEGSKQAILKPDTGNDPDLVPSIYNPQIKGAPREGAAGLQPPKPPKTEI
jgi:hypothetical protein